MTTDLRALAERIDEWCGRGLDDDLYPIEFICEEILPALRAILATAPSATPHPDHERIAQWRRDVDAWRQSTEFARTTTRPMDAGEQMAQRDAYELLLTASELIAPDPGWRDIASAPTEAEIDEQLKDCAFVMAFLVHKSKTCRRGKESVIYADAVNMLGAYAEGVKALRPAPPAAPPAEEKGNNDGR